MFIFAYWIVLIALGDKVDGTKTSTDIIEQQNTVVERNTYSQELRYRD